MAGDTTVYDCPLLELPRVENRAGNLTVLQPGWNCPFDVPRVYYLYDVPGGSTRGGHAHKNLRQLIVAAGGSFEVLLDDGRNRRSVFLNRPYYALALYPGIWRELHNFSSGSVCLVLASERYEEVDYIRDYKAFASWKALHRAEGSSDGATEVANRSSATG
ncbi:sugar 3,4-ketoisomerase [Limnoglobus roseus]|nr:FdtA/QdtA family cupin domain-containing protein [Limnoglobus roseus]